MSHVYWRLLFEGQAPNNNNTYLNISEIEMRATSGGADQCSGGTASADSVYSTQTADKAFDDNNSTYWESNAASGDRWIKYQFSAAVDVAEYVVRNGPFANEGPQSWSLQYSDNNSTWTNADIRHQQAAWSANESRTFTLDTGGATGKRYWRLNVTETSTTTSNNVAIREVQMRTSVGGADQCTGGAADSDTYTSGNGPDKAVDDNTTTTYWESGPTGGPWWWRYRFSADKDIVEYTVQGHSFSAEHPRDWTLEHSGNGVDWTVSDTRSGITWTSGETKTFSVTPATTPNLGAFFQLF